jgi:PHS family inorganic phosphate transporter-like MFS transporter
MDVERNLFQAKQDVDAALTSGIFAVDPEVVIQRLDAPRASWKDFLDYFSKWENGKVLLGTSYSWFALDIAFYGLGLNSTNVLNAIGFGSAGNIQSGLDVYRDLKAISVGHIILSVGGLIPGYYATMLLIDSWGRKPIQLMGFGLLTIILCCMGKYSSIHCLLFLFLPYMLYSPGFGFDALNRTSEMQKAFVFLYCMANFFQNFGPNVTTFIVPGEVFPTRYRSTAHGISAAAGKLGAIIAQAGFGKLKDLGGKTGDGHFIKHMSVLRLRSLILYRSHERDQSGDLRFLHVDRRIFYTTSTGDETEVT